MFRFNNPDALLILLLCAGAWAVTRAIDSSQHAARWMMLAGALVGFGFLTKMLQAFLILPAFGLAYLIAGKPALGKRIVHSALALVSLIVSAGWWVAIVELLPASARPYIGGSSTNSILELTLGYNGLGRLSGNETGSVGGGQGNPGWGGAAGVQGCSGVSSARRSRGCCRLLCSRRSSWSLLRAKLRGRTGRGRSPYCGVAGWSAPGWSSATCRGSSTATT